MGRICASGAEIFDEYLSCWRLERDGEPIATSNSKLLPVRRDGVPAILKIALEEEEKSGARLMAWWDGEGAARVLARDNDALLLERAESSTSLIDLVRTGQDDEASRIIGVVVAKIHAPKAKPLPELIPLSRWFRELQPAAERRGGIFLKCAVAARQLLASPQDIVVLHGDIHHGNILDFGQRGWLVIDPKGLIGERGFDYANLFCNPDSTTATNAQRFEQRLHIVGKTTGLELQRLLQWILAWAGLSAAWLLGEQITPEKQLAIAEMALAALIETGFPG